MSLLSTFIQEQLLKAIQAEFDAHAPDIQDAILGEIKSFASDALEWAEEKLGLKGSESQ